MGYMQSGAPPQEYEAQYCSRCVHYETAPGRYCPVMFAHMLFAQAEHGSGSSAEQILDLTIPKLGKENLQCRLFVEVSAMESRGPRTSQTVDLNRLLRVVAHAFCTTPTEILTGGRTKSVANARHIVMWTMRHHSNPKLSYPEIAKKLKRDHTTIINAYNRVEKLRRNPTYADHVDKMIEPAIRCGMQCSCGLPIPPDASERAEYVQAIDGLHLAAYRCRGCDSHQSIPLGPVPEWAMSEVF